MKTKEQPQSCTVVVFLYVNINQNKLKNITTSNFVNIKLESIMSKEILKREVRFAWHLPKTDYREDTHYVREDITYKDGTQEPHCYLITGYKRPIFVTKEAYRNHNDKKEFEDIDKLNMRMTTQSDIEQVASSMLGFEHMKKIGNNVRNSPYLYAYDVTSTSLIKYSTLKKNNFIQSPYSVAAVDIEANPVTQEILLSTVAFKNKVHTSINRKFVANISDVPTQLKKAIERYIPDYTGLDYTFSICENEVDLLRDNFKVINDWKPVFLAIWNMDFDIPKILERLKYHNVNPTEILCDQSIPRQYRVCRYKQGLKKKVTASGIHKPINPSLQWHTLIVTAPYYVIDAMCVYRQLRIANQEETSYSLDAILKKEGIGGKLKFEQADKYSGIKWHLFLQEKYPIEYTVYNIYDCLGMLELEKKTKDLSSTLPSFAGITDFSKFNSQIRKISDAVFLFGLEKRKIIGTVAKIDKTEEEIESEEVSDEALEDNEDEEIVEKPEKYKTLDLKGWIQLLPQNLLLHEGLQCLEEYPKAVTNIRGLTCDLDAASSYPSCILAANVSKETCVNELISIEGISEDIFREQNLSICLGDVNILEYFNVMFDLPSIADIDKYLD